MASQELLVRPIPDEQPPERLRPTESKIPVRFTYVASEDGHTENLLILLHGLGDTITPYAKLGQNLKLPQTCVLVLQAPELIPYLYEEAYQWYTSFDQLGELISQPDPTPAIKLIMTTLDHLTNDCHWTPNQIHVLGYAQGGTVAVESCIEFWKRRQRSNPDGDHTLGSVISIAGPFVSYPTLTKPCPTPLLAVHRKAPSESTLSSDNIQLFKKSFTTVAEAKLDNSRQGMPSSREEWLPIMKFWSERLNRRQMLGDFEVQRQQ